MNIIYTKHKNIKEESLIKDPVIVRVSKFDEEGYGEFSKQMNDAHNTGQTIIPVVIDSYGGHAYSLMGMISIIENAKLPVATIVESKAMSCGAILFTFGTEGYRYMSQSATLMIHDVASFAFGKIEEIKADVKEGERLNTLVYRMMDTNCNHPKGYFKKLVHERGHSDWYLSAKDCKKHKLTNHIGIPELEVNIGLDFKMI
jgi:ATP-dependent protease ClpP protease subunit